MWRMEIEMMQETTLGPTSTVPNIDCVVQDVEYDSVAHSNEVERVEW
jgi:hypothetical protein